MRRALHVLGVGLLSLVSVQIFIELLDWLARWDWLNGFMIGHPHIAAYLRTPISYVALLFLGFGVLRAERRLRQSHLVARLANSRIIPDRHTVTIGDYFANQEKKPGWDKKKLNWEWFAEVQFANDADTPTAIEEAEVRAWIRRKPWQRKIRVTAKHQPEIGAYTMDMARNEHCEEHALNGTERYREVDGLMDKIKNVHLTRGIGYRGWLRFCIEQVNQRDLPNMKTDIWLIDALGNRHKVQFDKKIEKKWDRSFYIFEDS
jgi:hypothetical protein